MATGYATSSSALADVAGTRILKIEVEPLRELGMCRSCSTKAGLMIPLIEQIRTGSGDVRTLLDVLNIVTNAPISSDDHLPQQMCYECYTHARVVECFVTRFRKTQEILKNFESTNQISAGCEKNGIDGSCSDIDNPDVRRKPYQCSICFQRYPNGADLQFHLNNIHGFGYGEVNKFECPNCSTTFSSYNTYESHLEECKNVIPVRPPSDCGSSSSHNDEMGVVEESNDHKISSSRNEKMSQKARTKKNFVFTCSKCDTTFDSKYALNKHLKTEHYRLKKTIKVENDNKKDLKIPNVSKKNLENYIAIEENIRIKTEDASTVSQNMHGENDEFESLGVKIEMLRSKVDAKKIKTKAARRNLKLAHRDDYFEAFAKPSVPYNATYHCTECERKFTKKDSFEAHIKKHERQSTIYCCNECKRQFKYKAHLENHQLSVHTSAKGMKCDMCPKRYSSQSCLDLHILSHKDKKKHHCEFCDKGFNMLSTLKDHIRTHTGEKPFLCSTCGRSFSQKTNLKEHMRRHIGFKPFSCDSCDQRFVSKGELVAHRRKHSGAHPFVCEECQASFTTSSSLVKHRRIHSGERPYECEVCPMRFTALGTLKNHQRTHTGEKPYRCKFCDKAFAQRNDQVLHMRCHTGERPYVCSACGRTFRQGSALKTHLKMCAHVHTTSVTATVTAAPVTAATTAAASIDTAGFTHEANSLIIISNVSALDSLSDNPI